ncbi:adenylyl cyclase [Microbacterium sp. SSM24]|uniref:adenylyl cyclase n=1 Tax=Microbacterium sp. SSM24 TaxID=2991714 RepID=UPI002227B5D2|nr:adenylyl cyclase [Microbacterium sp. SSM24]MCW3492599.1 adenylyl cyclase [Microbacterium sp. SSM24]
MGADADADGQRGKFMAITARARRRRVLGGVLTAALVVSGFTVATPAFAHGGSDDRNPDFGPNVIVVDPSMSTAQINALIAPVAGNPFRQILFKPGSYGSSAGADDPSTATDIVLAALPVNTAVAGLGATPTDTDINGALYVNSRGFANLGTFYRSLTNLSINPIQPGFAAHTMNWVTSQTAPFRRVNLEGNVNLMDEPPSGPAFGSHFMNTRIEGDVFLGEGRNTADGPGTWSQGMYFVRNSEIGGEWDGFGGVYLFSGVKGAPRTDFGPATSRRDSGDRISLDRTPITREAPFLYLDRGRYKVFVPDAEKNTRGVDWRVGRGKGESHSLSDFYLAKPVDTASQINAQLAKGKHLILTPGRYFLDQPLNITRSDTVVMGLGFATLVASAGTAAVRVGDVPGVILSSFNIDAGTVNSDVLLQVGNAKRKSGKASNPTTLTDVHILVPNPGKATTTAVINQDHVLIDGSWMKRADSGWTTSLADHGLIVNGDSVSAYGLWLEHYQKTQILWNGENGRVIFLQNEPPYDPPSQAAWMNGAKEGYPFLKVADDVRSFQADGVHSWSRFTGGGNTCTCYLSSAIETPVSKGVTFNGAAAFVISFPNSRGGYRHIFNDVGPAVDGTPYHLTSALPQSDLWGISADQRIARYPLKSDLRR